MTLLFVIRDKETKTIEFEGELESFKEVEPEISKELNKIGVHESQRALEDLKRKTGHWVNLFEKECFLMEYDPENDMIDIHDDFYEKTSLKQKIHTKD
jgi:hypothetical protein